jgi:uncharacterized protein YjbI with pentapeptide repeats
MLPDSLTDRSSTTFEDEDFRKLAAAEADISFKQFIDCRFTGCNFSTATLRECVFQNCQFKECDLSLVTVPGSVFSGVHFENSKITGVNLVEAEWEKTGLLKASVAFVNCNVSHSTFFGLKLKKLLLTKCIAHDVDFGEADLTGANFTHTDFAESRFFKTNLTQADFTHAVHYSIGVHVNTVKKAKFSLPEAMSLLHALEIVLVDD